MIPDLSQLLSSLPPTTLPSGRTVEPEDGGPPPYWLSDAPPDPGLWARLRSRHPESGLWPLLLTGLSSDERRPWVVGEVSPADMSSPELHDVAELLARWWADCATTDEDGGSVVTAPFGQDWPGLAMPGDQAEPPAQLADECAEFLVDGRTRLGLVPAVRGADTLAVAGWSGPTNHTGDAGEISAVLRSWEDRFGVRVVGVGFATLYVSVAAPPTTTGHALAVAAEHFAFCPDNVWQGAGSLAAYAEELLGVHSWSFWWD
ncbi:DUF4253 domain-containing protein [Micromonospora sp. SD12]|uniref:DUF4253 domain-containing protein n=1 Tax=Micromonospora sp. SD12 TaxID=3452216 RepID=UPI003F89DC3C